jgi:hypothetical protein
MPPPAPPGPPTLWLKVPNVIGLERLTAETVLGESELRYIAKFPRGPVGPGLNGAGTAATQIPAAGTLVGRYSIITVTYPGPDNPPEPPSSPIGGEGPVLKGTFNFGGLIKGVTVDRTGASIAFQLTIHPQHPSADWDEGFEFSLYDDQPIPLVPRAEWMRRGAMLSLAQRAFTNGDSVRITVTNLVVDSIELHKF